MRPTRWAALCGAVGLALAVPLAALVAGPAGAEVSGPCTGMIKGVDVSRVSSGNKNQAIKVKKTENVTVGATASAPIDRYKVQLAFIGRNWTVAKGTANGNSWSRTVNVADYARYGVGLYKVSGVSSGGANCTGAALVEVEGSAFGSIAGITALGLSVIGIGAALRGGVQGFICGPRPTQLVQSIQSAHTPSVDAYIADVKSPRQYVDCVEAICTYRPAQYRPAVQAICGNFRPHIERICLWG